MLCTWTSKGHLWITVNMLTQMDKIQEAQDKRSLCEDLTRLSLKLNFSWKINKYLSYVCSLYSPLKANPQSLHKLMMLLGCSSTNTH